MDFQHTRVEVTGTRDGLTRVHCSIGWVEIARSDCYLNRMPFTHSR